MYNQLGDYTAPQERKEITTVLDGIRNTVSASTQVTYVKGCAIRDTTAHHIPAAVEAAQKADAVVLVVGGSSARDFKPNTLKPERPRLLKKRTNNYPTWNVEKAMTAAL